MKKCRNILILLCLAVTPLSAQTVSNIRAQQEGREIAVYYDLSAIANVTMSVTADGKRLRISQTSGDIGKGIEAGEQKRIAWQVLDEQNGRFQAENVVFSVRANAPWRAFVLAEAGISPKPFQYSAGLMVGAVARAGVYAKGRSSFQFAKSSGHISPAENGYYCSPLEATLSAAEMPYYLSGKSRQTDWIVDAGVIARVAYIQDFMGYVYVGAGYGERQQVLQTYDRKWLNYLPTTFKGYSLDCGLLMAYKHLALSVGASTIAFKYAEIEVGIGYIF